MAEGKPYPNGIREGRTLRLITRDRLADLTAELAAAEPSLFSSISARSLERLERGETRPRLRVAAALAKALDADPAALFPHGPDDAVRNPKGNTRIPPDRPAPGRPRKNAS